RGAGHRRQHPTVEPHSRELRGSSRRSRDPRRSLYPATLRLSRRTPAFVRGEGAMHHKGKIACLLADGFEDSEFQIPCDWLSAAGYTVEIVGARAGDALKGEKGRET